MVRKSPHKEELFEMFTRQRLIFFVMGIGMLHLPLTKVFAQPPAVKAGMKEFNFMASLSTTHVEDVNLDNRILMAAFGYFLIDQHEMGLNLAYSSTKVEGDKTSSISPHLFYAFYVPTNFRDTIAYVGTQAGIGKMDSGDVGNIDIISYGLFGGIKFFLIPGAAITVQPSYLFQRWKNDGDVDVERFGIDLGIPLFLM